MRRMQTIPLTALLLSFSASSKASDTHPPRTFLVPGDFATIQEAVWVATDKDTVLVASGVYREHIDFLGKAIAVRAALQGSAWLEGQGEGSVVSFVSGETAKSLLEGFRIRSGDAELGAGLLCRDSGPSVRACTLEGGSARLGAGVACVAGATPNIEDCAFLGNSAIEGGAVASIQSGPRFLRCAFSDNSVQGRGGGIFGLSSQLWLQDCRLEGNQATSGAALRVEDGDISLSGSTFLWNTALINGSIVELDRSPGSVTNCSFAQNNAEHGVILQSNTDDKVQVRNIIIWDNQVQSPIRRISEWTMPVDYSLIRPSFPGVGNLDADPRFRLHYPGDLRLQAVSCGDSVDSPAIDAGFYGLTDAVLSCDAGLGEVRSDMGAQGGRGPRAPVLELVEPHLVIVRDQALEVVYEVHNDSGGRVEYERVHFEFGGATELEHTMQLEVPVVLEDGETSTGEWVWRDPEQLNLGAHTLRVTLANSLSDLCDDEAMLVVRTMDAINIQVPADVALIEDAIAVAWDGDAVTLAPGTYQENGLSLLGKGIRLSGHDPSDSAIVAATVVHGGNVGQGVFLIENGEDSLTVLEGFTISGVATNGTGILCHGTSPLVRDIVFRNIGGTALDCEEGSPRFQRVHIVDNQSGGFARGLDSQDSSPRLNACRFSNNRGGEGCAVRIRGGQAELVGCTFSNNYSASQGGAISANEAELYLADCRFVGNEADGRGGACTLLHSQGVILSSLFHANRATRGAGVALEYSTALIADCRIDSSAASVQGGGIEARDSELELGHCTMLSNAGPYGAAIYSRASTISVSRCSLVDNHARTEGSVVSSDALVPNFDSCVIWLNPGSLAGGDPPKITYSAVEGGWPGEGNIGADPLFCDSDCRLVDPGLAADSPCIGAGRGGQDMGSQPVLCEQPHRHTPRTLEVPGDFPSPLEAVAAACKGDTVVIAPGTYQTPPLMIYRGNVLLTGESAGSHDTRLRGEANSPVILFGGAVSAGAVLRDLWISDGGGAMGGGIRVPPGASATVRRCRVGPNRATRGGGLHVEQADLLLEDCLFADNTASADGAGLYAYGAQLLIRSCRFDHNAAEAYGGGACAEESSVSMQDCSIMSGSAKGGGALAIYRCLAEIAGSEFAWNFADGPGGAIRWQRSIGFIEGSTLAYNQAAYGASGLRAKGAPLVLSNSIFWNQGDKELSADSLVVSYSDVRFGWPGEGNINADPLFCDPHCAILDFDLAQDSPCLGAGEGGVDMGGGSEGCEQARPLSPRLVRVPEMQPSIAAALQANCAEDTISVAPGTYFEHALKILDRGVILTSRDPGDSAVVAGTVIDGEAQNSILILSGAGASNAKILGLTIRNGDARHGGGIRCGAGASALIQSCVITENRATRGGGISCSSADAQIIDCTITNNDAASSGGGILCSQSNPAILRCGIHHNNAFYDGGGGIMFSSSNGTLRNSTLLANYSYNGGALDFISSSSPTVANCIITENEANTDGGGCRISQGSNPLIINCVLVANTARQGGGVRVNQGTPRIVDSILWENEPNQIHDADQALVVKWSNVEGGWAGEGNIDLPPEFTTYREWQYMLHRRSPCIDAGGPQRGDSIDWPDKYHNGPRADMGAYGGQGAAGWIEGQEPVGQ